MVGVVLLSASSHPALWIADQVRNDGKGSQYDGRHAQPLWIADQVRNDGEGAWNDDTTHTTLWIAAYAGMTATRHRIVFHPHL